VDAKLVMCQVDYDSKVEGDDKKWYTLHLGNIHPIMWPHGLVCVSRIYNLSWILICWCRLQGLVQQMVIST
jgi:hypothetical protein